VTAATQSLLQRKIAAWFLRRQGSDRLPIELLRRRLYILPTRAGVGFGVTLFGMLIAALNYGNSMALLLTCLLTGFGLVAMHQCHRNIANLKLVSALANSAFAGDEGSVSLTLANDSRLDRYRVEIDAAAAPAVCVDLPPQSSCPLELRVAARERGLIRIDRLRISTTHPFGLFRAWSWVHTPIRLVVFPRPRGARPVPAHLGGQDGQALEPGAQKDEWLGLRPFREGDSPRQVAWKAYARGAPLLSKEYAASGAQERIFDFDRLEGLHTEARLEQLARWVVDAEARGERYGLVLPGAQLLPEHGPEHRRRALTALALHGIKPS
jgi:uncharacterized protein (DUF58 family)